MDMTSDMTFQSPFTTAPPTPERITQSNELVPPIPNKTLITSESVSLPTHTPPFSSDTPSGIGGLILDETKDSPIQINRQPVLTDNTSTNSKVNNDDFASSLAMNKVDSFPFGEDPFSSASLSNELSADPFASDSLFTSQPSGFNPDFTASGSDILAGTTPRPSAEDNKALLDQITNEQTVCPKVRPTESYIELSQYFPDSPIKDNPFSAKGSNSNENTDSIASNSALLSSAMSDNDMNSEFASTPKDALTSNQGQSVANKADLFAQFDKNKATSDQNIDSDAFSEDPFNDFGKSTDNLGNTSSKQQMGGGSINLEFSADPFGNSPFKSTENIEVKRTDPFADFGNFPSENEQNLQSINVDTFANFEKPSTSQKETVATSQNEDPFANFGSFPNQSNENSESGNSDPFADFGSFSNTSNQSSNKDTDPFADFGSFPSQQISSDNFSFPDVKPVAEDSVKSVEPMGKASDGNTSDLSDNFNFLQSLSKARSEGTDSPSQTTDMSNEEKNKDNVTLDDNFMFIQNLSKSSKTQNKNSNLSVPSASQELNLSSLSSDTQSENTMISPTSNSPIDLLSAQISTPAASNSPVDLHLTHGSNLSDNSTTKEEVICYSISTMH